jgi:hypothetical protein
VLWRLLYAAFAPPQFGRCAVAAQWVLALPAVVLKFARLDVVCAIDAIVLSAGVVSCQAAP